MESLSVKQSTEISEETFARITSIKNLSFLVSL